MNPSAAQHTLFEVKERPFHSGERMNADEGSPMRNAADDISNQPGDVKATKESGGLPWEKESHVRRIEVRKRNGARVGFPLSVSVSNTSIADKEDVLPFQRERSFSIDSSEEEEEKETNAIMGGITSSSPRARTNYNIGVDNAAADDESSAGVKSIANVFSNSFEKLKKMLGLTPECLNGGTKTMRGECVCPKYYKGDLCQEIVCVNNGTRVKVTRHVPAEYVCKCPHPEYISGAHCELVRCMNGGRAMDNGHCRCLDYWYTGQFCQNYTASWGAVLGVPLACIVVIIICCVVCRLDLCPRKQTRQRRRRRAPMNTAVPGTHMRRRQQATAYRDDSSRRGFESSLRLQENLLNEENPNLAAGVRPDPSMLPSYVIRLDTIPVFNPRMVGGVGDSELKPIDPPPPYEQAIASSGRNDNTGFCGGIAQRPPEYTPRVDQPPPPNFRPPDTPREQ